MKKSNYNLILLLFGFIILAFWSACGSDSGTTPNPASTTLTSITIERKTGTGTVRVPTGGTLNLTNNFNVSPVPVAAKLGTLTWTVDAKTGSSATAIILGTTLTAGITAGDMTLTVTSGTGDTAKSATIDIIISTTTPPLESFTIANPTGTLALGTSVNLGELATANPPTANIGTLTWTIQDTGTAIAGYSIDENTGVLTSDPTVVTSLSVTVQASTGGTDAKTVAKVITFPVPALASISIARTTGTGNVTVLVDATLNLNATYTVTHTPPLAVLGTLVWTVAPKGDSSATATITGTTLTAGATAGDVTVTVTSGTGDVAQSDTVDIKIVPPLTSFTIADPTGTLALGTDLDFSTLAITTVPALAVTGDLTWSIPTATTGYSIATGTSTLSSVTNDVTTLSVTVQASTGGVAPKTATKEITFPAPALASISVARTTGTGNVTVIAGVTLNLSTTFTVTHTPKITSIGTLVWTVAPKGTSSATARITDNMLTVGSSAGDMTLTVKSGTGSTAKSDTIDITIVVPTVPVTGVTVTSTGPVKIGTDYNLTATVAPATAAQSVTWNITTSPVPDGVSIENGILKTVAGTVTVGSTINITAISTADGATSGTKVTSDAVTITLTHALSLERKEGQGEKKVYVSGDPVDLNTVFDITPAPTGTLTWLLTQMGNLATIVASTGIITAVAAGDVQVSVTETVGGITKSSNNMSFTIHAAIANPVTDIELITKIVYIDEMYGAYPLSSKITLQDGSSDNTEIGTNWNVQTYDDNCASFDATGTAISLGECNDNIYFKLAVITKGFDKNGKKISKLYYRLYAMPIVVSSADSATIGTALPLTATVDGTAITSGLTWIIKDTAPTGVSIGGTSNNELRTTSEAQLGTVTVVVSYTVPNITVPTDEKAEPILPPIITAEQEITLAN